MGRGMPIDLISVSQVTHYIQEPQASGAGVCIEDLSGCSASLWHTPG
jgi:hypothetical protein